MSRAKVLARFVIEPARAGSRAESTQWPISCRLTRPTQSVENLPCPSASPLESSIPHLHNDPTPPLMASPRSSAVPTCPLALHPSPISSHQGAAACLHPAFAQSSTPLARQTLAAGCAAASRKQPGGRPCASCGRVAPRPLPRSACACGPVASWRKTFFEVFTPVSHTLFDLADIINKVLVLEAWNALSRRSMPVKCLEFNSYLIFLLPNCRTVVSGSRPPVLPLPKNELVAASIFSSRLTS